jgi:haloacetate dehalogenase
MARDLVDLMAKLGFDRFEVAGHDRGGRVAYRMALDHPVAVDQLAVLDIVPTVEVWEHMDAALAVEFWHWVFLSRPAPLPERLLSGDPEAYYFGDDRSVFAAEALADYLAACHRPETVHTMCEDYRAGATIDRDLDAADRAAGHRIGCPILVLWSTRERHERWYAPLDIWRAWAEDPEAVRGRAIDAGHYLAEEVPDQVATDLAAFFGAPR